jgi:hypothetical protein
LSNARVSSSPPKPLPAPGGYAGCFSRAARRWDLACLALLLVLTAGFFWRGLLHPPDLVREDASYAFQPYYQFAADEIAAGRFPHWNPYTSCGVPFHANMQGSLLYPLRWPMLWMEYCAGYVLLMVMHFWLTGVATYLLCRITLRCGPLPSLVGAISLGLGGFTVHLPYQFFVMGYPWFVLTVLLLAESIQRARWSLAVWAGLPIGLMALAGAAPLLFILFIGLGTWAVGESLVRLVARLRAGAGPWGPVLRPAIAIATAAVLGGLIGLAQLGPSMLQGRLSYRSQVGWEYITDMCSHPVRAIVRLVAPFAYGDYRLGYWGDPNYHSHAIYAGLGPLVAAAMAVVYARRHKWVVRILVLMAAAALLAAGKYLPVYRLFYDYVPMFDRIRNPALIFAWINFGVACLAAIGLQAILDLGDQKPSRGRMWATLGVTAAVGAILGGVVLRLLSFAGDPGAAADTVRSFDTLPPDAWSRYAVTAANMAERFFHDGWSWLGIAAAAGSAAGVAAMASIRSWRKPWAIWALAGLLVADLGVFWSGSLMYNDKLYPLTGETPAHVKFLQQNLGAQRYMSFRGDHTAEDRYRGMFFRIRNAVGSSAGAILNTAHQQLYIINTYRFPRLMNLAGVKYVVADTKTAPPPRWRVAYQQGDIEVLENPDFLPRAFLAGQVRRALPGDETLRAMVEGADDLRNVVWVDANEDPLSGPSGGQADLQDLAPGRYLVHTDANGPRQLVLTETYHPEWSCRVDGQFVPVAQSDYTFMSARVPAGRHEVLWQFDPRSFRAGLWGTLAGVLAVVLSLTGNWLFRRMRRQNPNAQRLT